MSTLASTLIICLTIVIAPVIWKIGGFIFAPTATKFRRPKFIFPSPLECIQFDLERALHSVRDCLVRDKCPMDFKGSAFPMRIKINGTNTWTPKKEVLPIVIAQLELAGWVIWRDEKCQEFEIILDLPRAKVPLPAVPAC